MSYCRFGWEGSDVYVYESASGLTCCGCQMADEGFICKEPEDMIAHLAAHRRAGQFVPEHAITGLWLDIPGAQRPQRGASPFFTFASLLGDFCRIENEMLREHERLDPRDKQRLPTGMKERFKEHKATLARFDRELKKRRSQPRRRAR